MSMISRPYMQIFRLAFLWIFCASNICWIEFSPRANTDNELVPTAIAMKRSFPIEVRSVGELESARSTSIGCSIRSDQSKIIDIISDGTHVNAGDLLVKIDPTPFEKKVEELQIKSLECEAQIEILIQALEWEIEQAEHENKTALFELESAEMELNKVINGDGPLEIARLKSGMHKAEVKYSELNNYSKDLQELENQGFLNPAEVLQTQKKIQEEKESFENAKLQYESYVNHVYPMQVKKAETSLKKAQSKVEEVDRGGKYKIKKAHASFLQAQQQLQEVQRQLQEAKWELVMTEIRAPTGGMVVLKEEFRSSQKRKPRVGDILVRNQTVLDLPDLSQMVVKTKVREIDLYKIDLGKEATIEVDAYPHVSFQGKITFIGILAMTDIARLGDEKNFEVKIVIDQSDMRLRPGMTARVVIHAGEVKNGVAVPIHAVFENNKQHFCYIAGETGYTKKAVKIGMNNEHWVEVLEGIQENDQVCLSLPTESQIIANPN